MNNSKVKVLYIAGSGRTGSTLLHNILGQINGFSAIGELHYIWERGFISNKLCGCGNPFLKCDIWRAVTREAFGSVNGIDARKMLHLNRSFRILHLPFTSIPHLRKKYASQLSEYLENLEKLYRAIQVTTGSRVIIDSSKTPVLGFLLRMIPAIELYVVHFIRDSRATAYSWSKKKLFEPTITKPEYMAQRNPVKSSLQWNARNILTELYLKSAPTRYVSLRYEDFIEKPKESIAHVLSLLDETSESLPFATDHTVEITKTNHSVFGNLVRFQTGTVELKADEEWKTKMKKQHRIIATALTWPLLLKYGYL